ncbi:Phosphate transport system permease protein PstC (TC 3.A.1.7.1) [Vibrio chagasii]|uniref:ABC transporter permease subunit n=1 Tax=Vibrio chagasii TaxID=170679 RepID=UPI00337B829A|nr:Phosphate transport system permease protein PstC (TC 3.A.1.7.1) [Vibrio chagasii]CAH6974922.1 Phosphate transport system permease protein PstC (TC 3.A.1.7.1) [Vibrio chagasii]CAH6977389.1 Phosphate transport system permease protein PstC (TC 3.A.1.7.1) [Vibrio chagasii]CAH6996114.1 Phosphate transport system permease protein PstC (TC 3.A.1.7.1) [Vibrio chagasii]CAH7027012.1 Phosphate transport system permease protein PstC (TC 3.A.1.7.1) [Vibrio chagasii]
MASAQFSLKERDKKRWLKDRLVRFSVTCGGVSVLAALVLIFVYLAMVILPVFSDTGLETDQAVKTVVVDKPIALSVDEYGQHAFTVEKSGLVQFWDLDSQNTHSYFERSVLADPIAFSRNTPAENWFAFADSASNITFFSPEYSAPVLQKGAEAQPKIEQVALPNPFLTDEPANGALIDKFAFSKSGRDITVAAQLTDQRVLVKWYQSDLAGGYVLKNSQWLSNKLGAQQQLLMTPDGQTLYLRAMSDLVVLKLADKGFDVREVIDLSLNDAKHGVKSIDLLSGAYSLLVTHQDGQVSQWFDVLKDEKRSLTHIRDFQLAEQVQFILPDTYRKGFYSFYKNGTLQSHYTTSEKLSLFERAFDKSPQLAAMSANELHLATLIDDKISVAKVDNEYPQISFSSLWQKVWYESYPEPQYVWQSTSANDDFEEKFSLVPITFGTIKAALFAMMFAVPVAVLGAIYTAYFMSPRMRRVVKPSIELMEALPTVIIGFLAGLWFAPIVETHLTAVFSLMVMLPLSALITGLVWFCLPKVVTSRFSNGWHALILIPVLIATVVTVFAAGNSIEALLFDGDIRTFLAGYGIDFDQRNALVVGFAMGFAVIPTIFTIAEDAIFSVPKHLSDGSLALGATAWQTLIYVVLLTASPGIFSAVMMGLGRAVGETMIVLMATGNTPILDWNILEGMRTLSATIAVELPESEVGGSHFRLLFLAALLLFIFTFAVNSLAEWVRQRLRDKYRAL